METSLNVCVCVRERGVETSLNVCMSVCARMLFFSSSLFRSNLINFFTASMLLLLVVQAISCEWAMAFKV